MVNRFNFQRPKPKHYPPSSEIQIQAIREELDAANKRVDQIDMLLWVLATLSEEIDSLRRAICHNCKKKLVPSYSLAGSSSAKHDPSPWQRIISDKPTQLSPSSDLPPVYPPNAREPLNTPITIHPVAPPRNHAKTVPSEASSPITPKSPVDSDWSVAHNPKIKQALHIGLVKTSNFTAKVWCVKFSPDGKYLAVGDDSGKTYIFDVEKRSNICGLADHSLKMQPIIFDVQFSPDSRYVAPTGSDGRIRVWDIARRRTISMFMRPLSIIYTTSFSPDGRFLVSTDTSGSICKWRIRDGYPKILISGVISLSVKFSPNGRYIASVHFNGLLMIWDARTNQLVHKWMGHTEPAYCLAFTPDGKGLVSGGGGEDKTKYWDVSSLVHSRSCRRPMTDGGMPILRFEGHTQALRSVAVCPENRWIVTASEDRSVRIWDARTATWQCTLQAHTHYVCAVDFSPDGKYLASGGGDRQVRLWGYQKA